MIFPGLPPFDYGAYHGSELPFLTRFGDVALNPAQQRLSDDMVKAWTRFAATGHPGWSRHDVRSFASGPVAPVDHRCELWSS